MRLTAGIILIIIGTIVLYRAGHKQVAFIDVTSLIFIYLGWLAAIGSVGFIRKAKANDKKTVKSVVNAAQIVVSIVVTFAQAQIVQSFYTKRVNQIMATEPTLTTTATIVDIDEYEKRVTIEYIVNNKLIKQSTYLSTIGSDLYVGKRIKIKYSTEYPEMYLSVP